jgi:hypothetical protein
MGEKETRWWFCIVDDQGRPLEKALASQKLNLTLSQPNLHG